MALHPSWICDLLPAGCAASLTRWQQITAPTCWDCGAPQQTMMHIVEDCPVTRFPSGLSSLYILLMRMHSFGSTRKANDKEKKDPRAHGP